MKKLLIIVFALVCASCERRVTTTEKPFHVRDDSGNYRAIEFRGHTYINYNGGHRAGLTHNPDCKCLNDN